MREAKDKDRDKEVLSCSSSAVATTPWLASTTGNSHDS
jgi:hypothetical protein